MILPSLLSFPFVHVCLNEDKDLSDALAESLRVSAVSLATTFRDWINFSLETEEASVIQLPFLGLTQDHLCIMRRAGRLFVIYAHPYQGRRHVAQILCHLNQMIYHPPHHLLLLNTTCKDKIRSVFLQPLSRAEAA
jgi:hypothetical protein